MISYNQLKKAKRKVDVGSQQRFGYVIKIETLGFCIRLSQGNGLKIAIMESAILKSLSVDWKL